MKRFVENFQTLDGILNILNEYTPSEIQGITSQILEKEFAELTELQVECLGAHKDKVEYTVLLNKEVQQKNLCTAIAAFKDEKSKRVIRGILRYWLVPDYFFLQEAICEAGQEEDTCFDKVLEYSTIEDIITASQAIYSISYGTKVVFHFKNFFEDFCIAIVLINCLRPDLYYELKMTSLYDVKLEGYSLKRKYRKIPDRKLRLLCIAKHPGEWTNVQLLKDKGLIPYLMYKNHNMNSVMAGIDTGDYPYLKSYVNGLTMDFLPNGEKETKFSYIKEHALDTDVLIVDSIYPINENIIKIYKQENPKGIVYMGLDANSQWMERIYFMRQEFYEMMSNVDVAATSCRAMQKHLNIKWPWNIEYIPNGYFHPWIRLEQIPYKRKEKIILTVSRLGTPQKDTVTMLEAFAIASKTMPDWKLRLVGSIEEKFLSYIDDFFARNPVLKNKIEFAGRIDDKMKLFEEYKKAAVFTLTSKSEGGAPNVIAEALHCSCAIATTRIDAWEDCIDSGRCGMACAVGDVNAVADMYINMVSDEERLKRMCERSFFYAEENYNMEKITSRIYESLLEVV